jgi:FixJ family two-component response regulator
MKAGAISILCEPIDSAELVVAVREALAQDRNRRVRKTELDKLARRFSLLTPRERDVLPLIIGGLLNKEAASILGISEVTLQIHRSHVMQKMEASSIAELVRMALRLRIPHWRADTRGPKLVVHSSGS